MITIMIFFYLTVFAMLMSAKIKKHFSAMNNNLTYFSSHWLDDCWVLERMHEVKIILPVFFILPCKAME